MESTMKRIQISPESGNDVAFTGALVAESDPPKSALDRWTRLSVYATDKGRYVLVVTGISEIPGERTRTYEANIHETATSLVDSMWKDDQNGNPRLSAPSKSLLKSLANAFPNESAFRYVEEA